MKKVKRIEPWMTEAFSIWLQYIGYQIILRGMDYELLPTYKCKNLPRGGCIHHNGQMNKVAKKLFAEFKEHVEA